jgi:hypothetical protein
MIYVVKTLIREQVNLNYDQRYEEQAQRIGRLDFMVKWGELKTSNCLFGCCCFVSGASVVIIMALSGEAVAMLSGAVWC